MNLKHIASFLALAAAAGAASADPASDNAARCQALSTSVQASFSTAVQARVPKQDPASFNQDTYDIKGIMSQDVTAGFAKLMNLDFSSIIQNLVNKGITSAMQKGTATFNNKMNSMLNEVGVPSIQIAGTSSGGLIGGLQNSVTGSINGALSNATNQVNNGIKTTITNGVQSGVQNAVGTTPTSPYSR